MILKKETPLMQQYYGIKAKYPGCIVLFRVGDFYETFGEDAKIASNVLGIILTKRANGSASHIELAGFPHHSLESYLPRFVKAGYRVAICDQLEDAKATKTIVKRGVTELVTPGVSYNDSILDAKKSNFLCSVYEQNNHWGIAFLDISTGEFLVTEADVNYVKKLIESLKPTEALVCKSQHNNVAYLFNSSHVPIQSLDEWVFKSPFANDKICTQLKSKTLKGFGIHEMELAIGAASACLQYLENTHHHKIGHINTISRIEQADFLWLDPFTIKNLEILEPIFKEGQSLLQILDATKTPMGSRLLKQWIVLPLKNLTQIKNRLNSVEFIIKNKKLLALVQQNLSEMGDIQRLISKVALQRIGPRECLQLAQTLSLCDTIQLELSKSNAEYLTVLANKMQNTEQLNTYIKKHISAEAPVIASKGSIFNSGVSVELDELRDLTKNNKNKLLEIHAREQEKTGITSLKIGFNHVFGYYLEVTNTHKTKVPTDWIRKQTLTGAERYITPELKIYEDKVLNAQEKIAETEALLWSNFLIYIQEFVESIQINAKIIAQIDCLFCFGHIAIEKNYKKPSLDSSLNLKLIESRHPVIEAMLPPDLEYIPNNIALNADTQRLVILTGPNMSGKSAILRQVALTVIMAQMGCYVPCKSAEIGLVDKVYSRVGASDNISQGESTFMVEMLETASILNNVGENTLIILDEIGRGTSTYDGLSLAWSIAEFLQSHPKKPKTLFATHYHELNELESKMDGIQNWHIEVRETNGQIVFMRKLKKGGSESSFGIHVAQMAGIPNTVLLRANQILSNLETDRAMLSGKATLAKTNAVPVYQLSMFGSENPNYSKLKTTLQNININSITPMDALLKLQELKNTIENEN